MSSIAVHSLSVSSCLVSYAWLRPGVIVRCWHTPRSVREWAERYEASSFEALLHELGLDHQHKALVAKRARLALRLRMALVLRVLLQCHCHPPETLG